MHVKAILQSDELRPTDLGIESGERPAVWFSANQHFEPSAAKAWEDTRTGRVEPMTMQQMHERVGLVRFGYPPQVAPIDWNTFKKTSGVSRQMARGMERGHNLTLWFASYNSVPISNVCVAIEMWDGNAWIPFEDRMRQLGMPIADDDADES